MSLSNLTPRQQKQLSALDSIPPVERSISNGELRVTRRFRGLTREQAIGYLEQLGGDRKNDRAVVGDGWQAQLSTQNVPVGPSYRLTEVTVTWTGEPEILERVMLQFRLKAFRAPG